MPWTDAEAPQHTKAATSSKLRRLWARVANDVLKRTGDEGQAVREANAAVERTKRRTRII